MNSCNGTPLIEPRALAELLKQHEDDTTRQIFILDCSWLGLPIFEQRDAEAEFEKLHIPGAHFFDIDACSNQELNLPHMMPTPSHFEEFLSRVCGKSARSSSIDLHRDVFIVYDSLGIWSAPRVWWMFKAFGATDVYILNGGLCAWMESGFPLADNTTDNQQSTLCPEPIQILNVSLNRSLIKSLSDIKTFVRCPPDEQFSILIDARPSGRFIGKDPEPRPDIPSGHIPSSVNIPWSDVLKPHVMKRDRSLLSGALAGEKGEEMDYKYFTYQSPDELNALFGERLKVPESHDLIFSCGSGVSAVVVLVASMIASIGNWDNTSLFDGSWVEWKLSEMKQ